MEIEERDVILIGLGDFGEKTINLFNDFLDERRHQIPKEVLKKINVYPISFKTSEAFNYTKLSEQIDDLVKDSQAKKFNGKFSYIFIGDLYDKGTSTYAIDYAYLPSTIEQAGSLKKKDVLGFFTFADAYGATISADNSAMASILRFFDRMEQIDAVDKYEVPYKDPDGHDFVPIISSKGPFDRSYVIVTPGNQEAVDRDTTQVFAERLFYEIYYLSSLFDKDRSNTSNDGTNGKLFSSFAMIQISRIEDLEHYFMKYTREDQISDYLLADSIKGTDLDYYQNQFFKLIDIPQTDEFPINRAVDLFISQNKPSLSQLLDVYQSKQTEDFKDYIETCKRKIDHKLEELTPKYTEFTRIQIDHMLETFELGYQQLFNINRLTGNINTYILYIEKLANRLNYWETSFKNILEESVDISMDKYYQKAEEKITAIQNNFIYKIPFFVPIRRKLIENVILGLPLEQYLKKVIKQNIAQAFLDQWQDKSSSSRNPVSDCEALIEALKKMKGLMSNKKDQIKQKLKYIQEMPSYYYVIFQKEQNEYDDLLTQIKSEHFGTHKKSELENQAKDFFKSWTEGKNRQMITNSSEFIKYFDAFIEGKTVMSTNTISNTLNADEFAAWSKESINSMDKRCEQLTHKSFKSDSNVVVSKPFLLEPDRPADQLSEQLKTKWTENSEINHLVVPREFTLGSVVYFQDSLWMKKAEFQKYENLLKYSDDVPPEPVYTDSENDPDKDAPKRQPKPENNKPQPTVVKETPKPVVEEAPAAAAESDGYPTESEMTTMDKIIRSVLLDYCEDWVATYWYKAKFDEQLESLSDEQVRKLAKAVNLADILESLDDKSLHDFAKELECPLSPVKDRQIELVVNFAQQQ